MDQTGLLRSVRFRAEREADWQKLELLVAEAERRGLHRMDFAAARDLAAAYRRATSSLAIAREISLDRALLEYLEALTARAYLCVYASQERVGGIIGRFFTVSAPQAMRRCWLFIALGFLCMGVGGLTGYLLYLEDESTYFLFLPPELAGGRTPEASTDYLRSVIYSNDADQSGLGAFAAFLFSHNTRIAIFVFGLGVFLCVPAILLAFYNGLGLGAIMALHVERGLGWDMGGWLSIHGVTELSAICIACGGGIKLGAAILFPGRLSRRAALQAAGRDAVKLVLVAAVMLFGAALLEGFLRQTVQDMTTRYLIGWGMGALWLSWFLFAGRAPR